MYLALVAIVAGQAAWFQSLALGEYAVVLSVLFHLRVVFGEEGPLLKQFGSSYEEYRRHVNRWLPRLTPWQAPPGFPEG